MRRTSQLVTTSSFISHAFELFYFVAHSDACFHRLEPHNLFFILPFVFFLLGLCTRMANPMHRVFHTLRGLLHQFMGFFVCLDFWAYSRPQAKWA